MWRPPSLAIHLQRRGDMRLPFSLFVQMAYSLAQAADLYMKASILEDPVSWLRVRLAWGASVFGIFLNWSDRHLACVGGFRRAADHLRPDSLEYWPAHGGRSVYPGLRCWYFIPAIWPQKLFAWPFLDVRRIWMLVGRSAGFCSVSRSSPFAAAVSILLRIPPRRLLGGGRNTLFFAECLRLIIARDEHQELFSRDATAISPSTTDGEHPLSCHVASRVVPAAKDITSNLTSGISEQIILERRPRGRFPGQRFRHDASAKLLHDFVFDWMNDSGLGLGRFLRGVNVQLGERGRCRRPPGRTWEPRDRMLVRLGWGYRRLMASSSSSSRPAVALADPGAWLPSAWPGQAGAAYARGSGLIITLMPRPMSFG